MASKNAYNNRKTRRRRFTGSRRFDRSCRNHGSCPVCRDSRTFAARRANTTSMIAYDKIIATTW